MSNSEIIREKIIAALQADTELSKIKVACDTEIEGRTSSYPVDLYLDFFAENGVNYKIIIQTQNIDKDLDKNSLFHFANVLQDISGQVLGVIFTQPVYDKLIQDVAKDVGIMLYEMRNLADQAVWEAEISNVEIDVDKDWVKAEKAKYDLGDTPLQSGGNPKYMFLYDEAGICVDSIEGVFNDYIRRQREANVFTEQNFYHDFSEKAMYLQTDHPIISKVKLNGIRFTVKFRNVTALDGKDIISNILRTAVRAKLN